ncbi:hypothetical protein V8C40DRAFT_250665 [Trichoderma camerunense]
MHAAETLLEKWGVAVRCLCDCDSHCRSSLFSAIMGLVHVPPAGYVQVTLARHTTPKDSLIFAVPISVQLLHSLSICSSYPLLAPQPRRDGKSSHHHHLFPATITIPKTNRRTNRIKKKSRPRPRTERLFLACPYNGEAGLGKPLTPQATGTLFGSANSKPEPTSVPRLAACCSTAATYWHSSREFPHLALLSRALLFASWGGIRVIREGHSFASGQKASSYGMGSFQGFLLLFFVKNWE